MKPENKQFLDANRRHYDTWVKAKFIQHLDGATRERMKNVIREEFFPNYTVNLWCPSCVTDMIVLAYTTYDRLENEKNELESKVQDEAFVFPNDLDKISIEKVEEPIKIKKKNHRRK